MSFPASPWEEYLNFAIESPRLTLAEGAVLVWTLYVGNDLCEPFGDTWDVRALPWRGQARAWAQRYRTFRKRSPFRQFGAALLERWRGPREPAIVRTLPDGRRILFATGNNELGRLTRREVEGHPNFSRLERTMVAVRDLAAVRGVRPTVLILPTKAEVYNWILEERAYQEGDGRSSDFAVAVGDACKRVGLRCLDLKPYLAEVGRRLYEESGEFLWWLDDTHWNPRGHEAVATFVHAQASGAGNDTAATDGEE